MPIKREQGGFSRILLASYTIVQILINVYSILLMKRKQSLFFYFPLQSYEKILYHAIPHEHTLSASLNHRDGLLCLHISKFSYFKLIILQTHRFRALKITN